MFVFLFRCCLCLSILRQRFAGKDNGFVLSTVCRCPSLITRGTCLGRSWLRILLLESSAATAATSTPAARTAIELCRLSLCLIGSRGLSLSRLSFTCLERLYCLCLKSG